MRKLARFGLVLVLVAAPVTAITLGGGCEIEFGCTDDACSSSSVGSTGSGECITLPPEGTDTHGFPPAVDVILAKNCRACHSTPLQSGAPQPWDRYEDTQEHYYCQVGKACAAPGPGGAACPAGTCGADLKCSCDDGLERWWAKMRKAVVERDDPTPAPGVSPMPFALPPIPQCEQDILSAWFATCGADTDANLCQRVESPTTTSGSSSSAASGSSSSSGM